jgi:hypothetical protein
MVMLCSLAQAKLSLRVDHTAEDERINEEIEDASAIILTHLKDRALLLVDTSGELLPDYIDSSGDPAGVPRDIQRATLAMVKILHESNAGDGHRMGWNEGFLPDEVRALLFPHRMPTVA